MRAPPGERLNRVRRYSSKGEVSGTKVTRYIASGQRALVNDKTILSTVYIVNEGKKQHKGIANMTKGKVLLGGSLLLFASLAFVGCSNSKSSQSTNSSGGGNTSTPGQAQGVYEGTTSNGLTFNAIVLPNDMFYAIYGNTSGNAFNVCGMATGQGASNNGKYTANENDFTYCSGSSNVYSGSVTATYTTGTTLNGSMTENNNPVTFTGTAPTASLFSYNAAALLSAISGSWSGSLTDGESATVTIDSLGNATGVSSGGCSFTGTITPDSSNKNFFDISLTFGGSPCVAPDQKASGIAVNYLLSDGVTNQFLAGVSSESSLGVVFAAER
jgi:hypothetical protein